MNSPVRTRPNTASSAEANLDELIDLLADGELDEPRRAALLRSLDAQPDREGWRQCALALLEAQAWRRAMSNVSEVKAAAEPSRKRHPSLFARLAIAAVIAAFAVGILLGQGGWLWTGPVKQLTQIESPGPGPSEGTADSGLIAHGAAKAAMAKSVSTSDASGTVSQAVLPDYVRRQLEREGYEVQGGGAKMIPVELPDGRRVNMPVETLRYQYVGRKVR